MSKPISIQKWLDRKANQSRMAAKSARKRRLEDPDRGVNRVPERLIVKRTKPLEPARRGTLGTFAPTYIEGGEVITLPAIQASHQTRRDLGQRGHKRRPRRRELPGALARRIEDQS